MNTIYRTIKIRIYPTEKQKHHIKINIDCARFIYNHMIERSSKAYDRRKEHLSLYDMIKIVTTMKKIGHFSWLKEADSKALEYACVNLNFAFQRFFAGQNNYPKFKSKRNSIQSYITRTAQPRCIYYDGNHLKVPRIEPIKTRDNRKLPINAKICFVVIVYNHDQYYANIHYKIEKQITSCIVNENNIIGLDYKSDGLYIDSNGEYCNMPHYYRKAQMAIAWEQHKLSRKIGSRKNEKPSGNFKRQQRRLYKKIRHVANQRKDFLHKQSTAIAKQYDAVCVEDLNMQSLANKGFGNGKATMDNGYGILLNMLEYKLQDRGKQLIKIDKWYPSSQLCSNCGHRQKMPLNIRTYDCPICGNHIDRDYNAAINIRNEGLRILQNKQAA